MAIKKTEDMEMNEAAATVSEDASGKKKSSASASGKPSWIKMKASEMEDIVVDLAKKGETPAKIGLILRDSHGVPKSTLVGKRITDILKEKKIAYKTDKDIIEANLVPLRTHIAKNKHDPSASRALTKKLWAVHNLEKYSKK